MTGRLSWHGLCPWSSTGAYAICSGLYFMRGMPVPEVGGLPQTEINIVIEAVITICIKIPLHVILSSSRMHPSGQLQV